MDRGIAVVDLETTGFGANDRVVEIGIVCADRSGDVTDEYETLIDPERDVGPTDVHGVTASMVSAAPRFAEVARTVGELLDGRVIAAHNAPFDTRFIEQEFGRIGLKFDPGEPICTLRSTGTRLNLACEDFGVGLDEHHRAIADARACLALIGPSGALDASTSPAVVRGEAPFGRSRTTCRPGAGPTCPSDLRRVVSRVRYPAERPAVLTYVDALDWALNDNLIDEQEQEALEEMAREIGLTRDEQLRAHDRYMDAVIAAVERDGIVTDCEHEMMSSIASSLGLERRLPQVSSDLSTPLAIEPGWKTCFTGTVVDKEGEVVGRSRLEEIAEELGLTPVSSVTKATDLLVAADPTSSSGKAKKARAYGLPVVSALEFLDAGLTLAER